MTFCINDEMGCPLCGQLPAVGEDLFNLPEQDEVVASTVANKGLRNRVIS